MLQYAIMNNIMLEKKEAILFLRSELIKKGWCFVKFSDTYNSFVADDVKKIENFFDLPNNVKLKYQYEQGIGFKTFDFKDHLHVLTGNYKIPNFDNVPDKSETEKVAAETINTIANGLDRTMVRLTNILSKYLFKLTTEKAQMLSITGNDHAGLLDFVKYKPIQKQKEMYVKEHCDPGLFSVNIYSDSFGMQFYDPISKEWTSLPQGYGVIFCGTAAKMLCGIPAAKHRVVNNGTGRFSIWYEVGVKSQLPEKNKIKRKEIIPEKLISSENEKYKTIDVYVYEEADGPDAKPTKYEFDKGINDKLCYLKLKLEEDTGIPTSKSIQYKRHLIVDQSVYKKNKHANISKHASNDPAQVLFST